MSLITQINDQPENTFPSKSAAKQRTRDLGQVKGLVTLEGGYLCLNHCSCSPSSKNKLHGKACQIRLGSSSQFTKIDIKFESWPLLLPPSPLKTVGQTSPKNASNVGDSPLTLSLLTFFSGWAASEKLILIHLDVHYILMATSHMNALINCLHQVSAWRWLSSHKRFIKYRIRITSWASNAAATEAIRTGVCWTRRAFKGLLTWEWLLYHGRRDHS